MPAAVHTPIHLGAPRQVPVVASREVTRTAGRGGVVNVSRAGALRWHTPLEDALGIPIALAIVLLLWAGRAALGAF
jgi:hypothetical protein